MGSRLALVSRTRSFDVKQYARSTNRPPAHLHRQGLARLAGNQARLAAAAKLDRSSLVPALDKLEARDLVARRAAPGDRRANGLHLTGAGADLLARAKVAVRRHEARLAAELKPGERELLIGLLSGIFPGDR